MWGGGVNNDDLCLYVSRQENIVCVHVCVCVGVSVCTCVLTCKMVTPTLASLTPSPMTTSPDEGTKSTRAAACRSLGNNEATLVLYSMMIAPIDPNSRTRDNMTTLSTPSSSVTVTIAGNHDTTP